MIKSELYVSAHSGRGFPQSSRIFFLTTFLFGSPFTLLLAQGSAGSSSLSGPAKAGTTNRIVAAYDGGKITAAELAEHQDEAFFVADAEQNAPTDHIATSDEKLARHLAAMRLLTRIAGERGLTKAPDWALQTKLIEQRVLSQALHEDVRHQVFVSDKEFNDQWATNRYFILGVDTIEARRIGISQAKHGDKALDRAKEALAQIRAGQKFEAVAKKYSDLDPKTAQIDTYLANFWGKQSGLALAQLGEGKVSEPIATKDGYELVRVEHLAMHRNPGDEEARNNLKAKVTELAIADHIAELTKAAADSFPLAKTTEPSRPAGSGSVRPANSSPPTSSAQTVSSTNPVLLTCGLFTLNHQEVHSLAVARAVATMPDDQMLEIILQEDGYPIQMGELARNMGFAQRPLVQKALRYQLDKELAEKAKALILPEFAATMSFDEGRVRETYDTKFTASFEPLLEYDFLLVSPGVSATASGEERAGAISNAQARAQSIIQRIHDGASFDSITHETGLQLMAGQSRVVGESSALFPLVAGLKAGDVVSQPYEDFGGAGVIRVKKYEPRRKMPFDIARNYILVDFRNEALTELRRNFEPFLLEKYHFVFGAGASTPPRAATEGAARQH